ncbi:MAG: hypothetical protein HY923_03820 [Elusimicrobia bacterium]|nr:hypothetical protein [Elusimicrobiota bacterium]
MKPALLVVTSALFSSPFIPLSPVAIRVAAPASRSAAPARAVVEATDISRLIWLAKADATQSLHRTEFRFSRAEKGVQVLADPSLLRAGLSSLMTLSAQSMKGRKARMGLRLSASSGRLTLELRDCGPGMSVQELVAMYGNGHSGLSEARRQIERSGGVINVSSEEGAGTVYLIDLPVASRSGRETRGS